MKKKFVSSVLIVIYSLVLVFSAFFAGRFTLNSEKEANVPVTEEEKAEEEDYYTAKEINGKLAVYKNDKLLMSLDTNVEMLPSVVRSQLKKGIDFKASELPGLLEAFSE